MPTTFKTRAFWSSFLGAGILVAGIWAWNRYTSPDRFIYDAAAVDTERAFVLMRKDYDRPEPHWVVGVTAADGRLAWSTSVTDSTIDGVAVAGEVAVVWARRLDGEDTGIACVSMHGPPAVG